MIKGIARTAFAITLLTLPGVFAAAQDTATEETLRAAFITAYRDALLGSSGGSLDVSLREYVLYPYLEAASIARALATASGDREEADVAAEAFVARHDGEPVARIVESAWLESLARRGHEARLIERFSRDVADTALECRYLAARIDLEASDGLNELVVARWLTGAQLPPECEPVFEWGRNSGVIDDDAIEARVRLLLGNGRPAFARIIARPLPESRAAPLLRWAALIETPVTAFDALIAMPEDAPDRDALLDAWSRFARNDPEGAHERLAALIDSLMPEPALASELHRALALGLAWDRNGAALEHFSRIDRRQLDDYTREWQARAALWAGEWPTAADAIAGLSSAGRAESAWRYWTARADEALGNDDAAQTDYESLTGDDNFYAALASARIGRPHVPAQQPLHVAADDLAALTAIPGFERARELHAVGLEPEARREWNAAYESLPNELRRASIRLAATWNWYEIAVLTATRNDVFYDYELLYPVRFTEHVPAAADLTAFDRSLLYALIRQESLFAPEAVSTAGAIGLTQLRLETAQRAASRWDLERPSRSALFDPQTNITLGAAQLRNLIDEFDGQLLPGIAGYNAGYNAAARWLPDTEIDADVWVENIPFNETRAYVRRVLWHSLVYDWLETKRPQDATRWLTPVRRP